MPNEILELNSEQLEFWIGQIRKIITDGPNESRVVGLTRLGEDLTEKLSALDKERPRL